MDLRASLAAYEEWHCGLETNSGADSPWHRLIQRHLNPHRDIEGRHLLEIGCGRGGFALWLAQHNARPTKVIAADFSRTAIAIARKRSGDQPKNLHWMVQDIQDIGLPENTFDTIFSCETIEHVPSPTRAVRELARVLKPGGRLFLTTPNYMNAMGLYRCYLRLFGRTFRECGQPINTFTTIPRTLMWIRRAGLDCKVVDGTLHPFPLPGRPPLKLVFVERAGTLAKYVALQPLILCVKPYS